MTAAVMFAWRAHRRRGLGAMGFVVLVLGLVGGLAIASFAGARRTASTFAAYERDVRLSHVAVNTFVPDLDRVDAIARLPGVESSATYLGLNGFPVVAGEVIEDFRYTGLFGTLDGRFFVQDRATVVQGRLPRLDATDEIALTPGQARFAGVGVGDRVTYVYRDQEGADIARHTYRLVGIVELPPVIVDENDIIQGAILPPAATEARLDAFYYAWQGIRLVDGLDGIERFVESLRTQPLVSDLPPVVQLYDEVRARAQRSVRPQAVALALFALATTLAAVALAAQGAARLVRRWTGDAATLRALGLTRTQVTAVAVADAAVAVATGVLLAAGVALAMSPFAPVGAVRDIAPDTGVQADWVAVLGGVAVLGTVVLAMTVIAGWRVWPRAARVAERPSAVVGGAARAGLPVSVVVGAGFAAQPPGRGEPVRARASLVGTAVAMIAVVAAIVFGASLNALTSNPDRYGWTWDHMLIAQGGYGSLPPDVMTDLVESEPDVTGWSLLAFDQLTIDGTTVPVLGLDRRRGGVEPPTVDGRPVTATDEIAVGVSTLSALGKRVGDRVTVSTGDRRAELRVVGSATFPAIGVGGADHPSLGRGAILTFQALSDLVSPGVECLAAEEGLCPRAVVFDVAPGADGDAVAERIAGANPDGLPGGTYPHPVSRPADIRNYDQMASLPVALASVLAAAAVVALILTLFASARARRRDLAVLKVLGATAAQLRAAVAAQAITVAAAAVIVGLPLGIAAGRLSWIRFADDAGVLAVSTVPLVVLFGLAIGLIAVCAVTALLPATLAARTVTSRALRTE